MIKLLQGNALAEICRRYKVRRLELFGSAATKRFDSDRSDIDFLVEFLPNTDLGPWMKEFFALRDQLSRWHEREVDLVMTDALRDIRFQQEAAKTRKVIYDASKDGEVAS
jgi:predicted nucleotidyltransferase